MRTHTVWGVLGLLGCGPVAASSSDGCVQVAQLAACVAYEDAWCDRWLFCCQQPGVQCEGAPATLTACRQWWYDRGTRCDDPAAWTVCSEQLLACTDALGQTACEAHVSGSVQRPNACNF